MTLSSPWSLLALLALPLLWYLSLPARPRAVTWTPHLAQWRQALVALRRRPPRLARWRFVLLALAALGAIAAAAQPVWRAGPGPQRLVVVLDGSESMAARDANAVSAWVGATAALRGVFATLPEHVEVTVLRAGGLLQRRHGASARNLQDLPGPQGELQVDLGAVAAAAAREPGTAVWTLTDGQGQAHLPADGALTVLPRSGPNAAILRVRLADAWPLPAFTVAADVVGFAPGAGDLAAEVAVTGACAPVAGRPVALVRGAVQTVELAVERNAAGGEILVRVALPGDVLPDDDCVRIALPPLPAPRIAVLADGEAGPFATAAAQALAGEVGGSVVGASGDEPVGLLLVDGGRAAIAPGRVRALTFGSAPAPGPAPEPWRGPFALDWDRSNALTAGLDLSELMVQQAWRGVLPAGEPLLWANEAGGSEPLAVVAGDGQVASVHFAFRLQDSNLPLLPAFPQLLRRAFVRSYGSGAAATVLTPPAPLAEVDLRGPAVAADRALPAFAAAEMPLWPWCLLAGLLALALRAWVR